MAKTVEIDLADGTTAALSRARILEAATSMDVAASSRFVFEINGRHLDALALVARAAGIASDLVRVSDAAAALEGLGFTRQDLENPFPMFPPLTSHADAVERLRTGDLELPLPNDIHLTKSLLRQLQRSSGKWVAVSHGNLLGEANTLLALLDSLANADSDATVMHIPSREDLKRDWS